MSLLDEIASFLQAQGVGTAAVDIFAGTLPAEPTLAIGLYEYQGSTLLETFSTDYGEQPGFQVVSRGPTYVTARAKAKLAWDALRGISNEDISGTRYFRLTPNGSIGYQGRDENGAVRLGFNCKVQKVIS